MSETTAEELLSLVEATFTKLLEKDGGSLNQDGVSRALKALAQEPAFGGAPQSGAFISPNPIALLTDPFDILLARRFMHLMASPQGRTLSEGALSLRVLPGFFQVVRMMIGSDKFKQYRGNIRNIHSSNKSS